jgi:hypothetical protein
MEGLSSFVACGTSQKAGTCENMTEATQGTNFYLDDRGRNVFVKPSPPSTLTDANELISTGKRRKYHHGILAVDKQKISRSLPIGGLPGAMRTVEVSGSRILRFLVLVLKSSWVFCTGREAATVLALDPRRGHPSWTHPCSVECGGVSNGKGSWPISRKGASLAAFIVALGAVEKLD